jgi:hypothetical protein
MRDSKFANYRTEKYERAYQHILLAYIQILKLTWKQYLFDFFIRLIEIDARN